MAVATASSAWQAVAPMRAHAGRRDRTHPCRSERVPAEADKIAEVQGMISIGGSAMEVADFMRTEVDRWATIIKAANLVKE
jgi:hypothetical protein